jgi:hypothetical protein
MPAHGIPRRSFTPQAKELTPFNWRRGLLRVWLLLAIGWIMSWAHFVILLFLQGRITKTDFLVMPVLLFVPPIALLVFGVVARWAFRGFQLAERSVARRSPEAA